jgi:hypothetical protein
MDRRAYWPVPIILAVLSTAEAAEPGFYAAATAGRVEQELDQRVGTPVAVLAPDPFPQVPPPSFGLRPPPGPITGIIGGGVFSPVQPIRTDVDDVDAGFSVALGYRVNQYLAAEVAYMDFGEGTVTQHYSLMGIPPLAPPREFVSTYNVHVRGPAVSVLGSYPVSTAWQVFVRGGVLFADQEVEVAATVVPTSGSPTRFEQTFSDEVLLAGAGVQWSFAPRWTARVEYQRTGDLERNILSGESSIDQASLSVLFSL